MKFASVFRLIYQTREREEASSLLIDRNAINEAEISLRRYHQAKIMPMDFTRHMYIEMQRKACRRGRVF